MAKAATVEATSEIEIAMTYKKSTPGTHVYASDDPDAAVTQLYIRKSGMPTAPKAIKVSVFG